MSVDFDNLKTVKIRNTEFAVLPHNKFYLDFVRKVDKLTEKYENVSLDDKPLIQQISAELKAEPSLVIRALKSLFPPQRKSQTTLKNEIATISPIRAVTLTLDDVVLAYENMIAINHNVPSEAKDYMQKCILGLTAVINLNFLKN